MLVNMQLLLALNFIKCDRPRRKRLADDRSAACVALKLTKYEPMFDELSVWPMYATGKPH